MPLITCIRGETETGSCVGWTRTMLTSVFQLHITSQMTNLLRLSSTDTWSHLVLPVSRRPSMTAVLPHKSPRNNASRWTYVQSTCLRQLAPKIWTLLINVLKMILFCSQNVNKAREWWRHCFSSACINFFSAKNRLIQITALQVKQNHEDKTSGWISS